MGGEEVAAGEDAPPLLPLAAELQVAPEHLVAAARPAALDGQPEVQAADRVRARGEPRDEAGDDVGGVLPGQGQEGELLQA